VERLVFDDGRDDGVSVGEAHEVVVHGAGSAAAAVLVVVVHALVRDGWLAAKVVVAVVQHGGAPPGVSTVVSLMLLGLGEGSHTLVNS
jgi:hypothetical protein